jgi:hypothetical protein
MSREVLSAVENHTQRTGPLSINLSRPGQDALIVPAVFDRRKQMPFLRCPAPRVPHFSLLFIGTALVGRVFGIS